MNQDELLYRLDAGEKLFQVKHSDLSGSAAHFLAGFGFGDEHTRKEHALLTGCLNMTLFQQSVGIVNNEKRLLNVNAFGNILEGIRWG